MIRAISRSALKPVVAASLLTLLAGGALAQGKPTFESLDKNGDGKISLSEASENDALFVAFKSLDTDKDGSLTREEFAKYK
jgi:Ca2+-binding EF-hand superfamily protein